MEPRTWLTELIEADYVDTDRMFTTVNYSRSIFEETVRRRDELRARLLASQSDLASAQLSLSHGLEPDSHGQRWLIVATLQAQTDELARLYNETMARDAALRAEHATEFAAIMPREMATCDNRLRLTPSAPGRAGAAWHATAQRVEDGFQATFLLQVSARNRLCRSKVELQRGQMGGRVMTEQRDECLRRDWSLDEWNVREFGLDGGDGFAFVIQGAGTATVGGPGAQLGYGGLAESVAVEFDMFYDADLGDANDLHVALHANGHQANGPGASTRMGQFRGMRTTKRLLQDGEKHTVRVVYTPGMDFNPFAQPSWPAEPHLFQFVKADGLGSLRVFVDDMDTAVINAPLSLKYAVRLQAGRAYVGFTAATGSSWQNHDILSWTFKEYSPNPWAACAADLPSRDQCVRERSWAVSSDGQLIAGQPYFEPGSDAWAPARTGMGAQEDAEVGSTCLTCP